MAVSTFNIAVIPPNMDSIARLVALEVFTLRQCRLDTMNRAKLAGNLNSKKTT